MKKILSEQNNSSLFFTGGYVVSSQDILVSAKLNMYAEDYFSRVCRFKHGKWSYLDITDSVHSVTYDYSRDVAIWLGQAGTVTEKKSGVPPVIYTIADAERFGNLNRIRSIGDDQYICGYGGQVYKRGKNVWNHMDDGLFGFRPNATSVDLLDMDGTSPDDIYVVGTKGAIFHYDGKQWKSIDCPTKSNLTCVRCVSPTEVYIAGYSGTIFKGSGNKWEVLFESGETGNFYGLEVFQGQVYLAHNAGLVQLNGQALTLLNLGLPQVKTFYRLQANDGVLWSFGTDHLAWFDGNKWEEIVHPDNEP